MFYENNKRILLFNPYDGIPDVFKSRQIDTFEDRVMLLKLINKVIHVATYTDIGSAERKDVLNFLRGNPHYLIKTRNGHFYGWDSEKETAVAMRTLKMDPNEYEEYANKNGYIPYHPDIKDTTYYMEERE